MDAMLKDSERCSRLSKKPWLLNWEKTGTRRKISLLEQKEVIDDALLEHVAKVLKVPVEAIKNFDEDAAISFIGNTYSSHDNSSTLNGYTIHYNPTFNPIEKWIEIIAENKNLYERLLKEKDEKIALLDKLLKK